MRCGIDLAHQVPYWARDPTYSGAEHTSSIQNIIGGVSTPLFTIPAGHRGMLYGWTCTLFVTTSFAGEVGLAGIRIIPVSGTNRHIHRIAVDGSSAGSSSFGNGNGGIVLQVGDVIHSYGQTVGVNAIYTMFTAVGVALFST